MPEMDHSEQWKPVKGYEGVYSVSSLGKICSDKTGRILKASPSRKGYLRVCLCFHQKQLVVTVHKIVLNAFIGERPQDFQCNHVNGIKYDNRVENLEWVTAADNVQHSLRVLGVRRASGESNGSAKLTAESVRLIRARRKNGETAMSIAREYGVSENTVFSAEKGITWATVK